MKLRIGIFTDSMRFTTFVNKIDVVVVADCNIANNLESFLSTSQSVYDIILIDYDTMKEISFKIASSKYFYDAEIIFVTSQKLLNYKLPLRLDNPQRFVYISQLPMELTKVSNIAIESSLTKSISLQVNKDFYKLYFSEIYCVYSNDHYLKFSTLSRNEDISSRLWAKDVVPLLIKNGFVKCKGSVYINVRLIEEIEHEHLRIRFINGKHEPYSRRNYKEISKRFLEGI